MFLISLLPPSSRPLMMEVIKGDKEGKHVVGV
jgi:hypothetical protein